jgi:hypothetical protein
LATCDEKSVAPRLNEVFSTSHAHGLQAGFGAAQHFQAELVVLVDRADLLGAFSLTSLGTAMRIWS